MPCSSLCDVQSRTFKKQWPYAVSNMSDFELNGDGELATESAKPALKQPPKYQVVLLNDDYTPMEFVVLILETFFSMDRQQATQVMLHVHTRGKGICGVFTRDVAETKVEQVNRCSRENENPLKCVMELVED